MGQQNVQKAGKVLAAMFPWMPILHGAEHAMSLFFNDLFKQPELKKCIDIVSRFIKFLEVVQCMAICSILQKGKGTQ